MLDCQHSPSNQQWLYMLANVHHQINNDEVLPPPKRFWYYVPDLPIGI
jgi:hypothetical protein